MGFRSLSIEGNFSISTMYTGSHSTREAKSSNGSLLASLSASQCDCSTYFQLLGIKSAMCEFYEKVCCRSGRKFEASRHHTLEGMRSQGRGLLWGVGKNLSFASSCQTAREQKSLPFGNTAFVRRPDDFIDALTGGVHWSADAIFLP